MFHQISKHWEVGWGDFKDIRLDIWWDALFECLIWFLKWSIILAWRNSRLKLAKFYVNWEQIHQTTVTVVIFFVFSWWIINQLRRFSFQKTSSNPIIAQLIFCSFTLCHSEPYKYINHAKKMYLQILDKLLNLPVFRWQISIGLLQEKIENCCSKPDYANPGLMWANNLKL